MTIDYELERAILELYGRMLDIPEPQRDDWLAQEAGNNPPLLSRINAMRAAELAADLPTGGARDLDHDEEPPKTIGAYRVVQSLGSGGMGSVYLAERQAGDFDHRVAIKVIKSGVFSQSLVERFANERRLLAQLNHPNIAHLYDGGEMPDGAPYLVMEYVQGLNLNDWMSSTQPDDKTKLAVFLQICDAVEYAHQNLVIHRDLTPNNVLVTQSGQVKLIDFGIARPYEHSDIQSPPSSFSGLSLTPGFAAPERLAGAGANTLVDVFSLGRILHVLFAPTAHKELDAIAARAAAPEPSKRYQTMTSLSQAVRDWREDRPIEAFSQSRWYRVQKFIKRQKLLVFATLTIATTLILGIVGISLAYQRAEHERATALQRFSETRTLSSYLINTVVRELEAIPGTASIRRDIAERGQITLERLSKVDGASADLRAETANAYRYVGEALASPDFGSTGNSEMALAALAKAEKEARALVVAVPENRNYKIGLAKALTAYAFQLIVLSNNVEQAAKLLDESERLLASIINGGNEVAFAKLQAATTRAAVYNETSQYNRLYPHLERTIAYATSLSATNKDEVFAIASALNTLHVYHGEALYYDRNDLEGALRAYQASISALANPAFAADIRVMKRRVFGAFNLASTLFETGRKQEALAVAREGIELVKRMRLFDDSIRSLHLEAIIHGEYSLELFALGQVEEAEAHATITLNIRRELAKRMPKSYEAQRLVPVAQRALGEALEPLGNMAKACAYYQEARAGWAIIAQGEQGVSNFDQTENVDWIDARIGRCAK